MEMTQRGHVLDDSWYLDYAAGTLGTEAQDVMMASHVELSDEARGRVAALETLGGAMLDASDGEAPLGFSVEDILRRAGGEAEEDLTAAPATAAPAADDSLCLPQALQDYLVRTGTPVRWGFLGPGMRKAILWRGEHGERLWLLRAQPGVAIPHHGHNGSELTLVLKGSFWDGEQEYRPGDVEEAHPGVEHDIRIDEGGECICLALTEGKLKFESPVLRAFQVFTGL
jgi:putative transcriptional regulator